MTSAVGLVTCGLVLVTSELVLINQRACKIALYSAHTAHLESLTSGVARPPSRSPHLLNINEI